MTEIRMELNGETRLYGIVGDPIAQTLSPQNLTPLLSEEGVNGVLMPLHVPADRFREAMAGLMALRNFHGTMVTYPFKAEAARLVDRLEPSGAMVGAINAMRREPDGSWSGDIFDGRGLVAGLAAEGIAIAGRAVMLLGAGGAGSAIALALAEAGVAALTIFDVDAGKASALAGRVAEACPAADIRSGPAGTAGHDMLVNATPMGMNPGDPLPIEGGGLRPGLVVMDIVPKPDVPLVAAARAAGCRTVDYRAMALGQYAAIARFFAGR